MDLTLSHARALHVTDGRKTMITRIAATDYRGPVNIVDGDCDVVMATATLVDCLPVYDFEPGPGMPAAADDVGDHVMVGGDHVTLFRGDGPGKGMDHERPYGEFHPGRMVWLLADVHPVALGDS